MLPLALGLMFVGGAVKCHVPVAYLVAGCNGRSYSGQRIDSCGYHGSCRCISGGTYVPTFIAYAPNTLHMVAWVGAFHRILCSKCGLRTIRY